MSHFASLETNIWVCIFFYNYIIFIPGRFQVRTCGRILRTHRLLAFKYLRPWLLSQKLSIGRFIPSSN